MAKYTFNQCFFPYMTFDLPDDTSSIEALREEISRLRDRLPQAPIPSPSAQPSPMAASAPSTAPMSAPTTVLMHIQYKHLLDLDISMAGPMTTSTAMTPPRRSSPKKRTPGKKSNDMIGENMGLNIGQLNYQQETTPTFPVEGRNSDALPLLPALVGSAHPDTPDDVTITNNQSQHTSLTERLNRMSEQELRFEIQNLNSQLTNAKNMCSELKRKLDNQIEDHLVQKEEKLLHSPNKASEIIKRLKIELETSRSRLNELERRNALPVLMESSQNTSVSKLKSELGTSQARLHDQTSNLAQKNSDLSQVTCVTLELVDRLLFDLTSIDSELTDLDFNELTPNDATRDVTHDVSCLDDVCRMLNEILIRQNDLRDQVTSMEDHVTSKHFNDVKQSTPILWVVQSVANTMDGE